MDSGAFKKPQVRDAEEQEHESYYSYGVKKSGRLFQVLEKFLREAYRFCKKCLSDESSEICWEHISRQMRNFWMHHLRTKDHDIGLHLCKILLLNSEFFNRLYWIYSFFFEKCFECHISVVHRDNASRFKLRSKF